MTRTFRASLLAATIVLSGASLAQAKTSNPMVGGAAMYPTKNIVENAVNS